LKSLGNLYSSRIEVLLFPTLTTATKVLAAHADENPVGEVPWLGVTPFHRQPGPSFFPAAGIKTLEDTMLNKLSLKVRLGAGFGLLLGILGVLSVVSYRTILSIDDAAIDVDHKTTERELAATLEGSAMKESSGIRGYLLTGQEKALERDEQGKSEMNEALGKLASLVRSEEAKRIYAEIQRANEGFRVVVDEEIRLHRDGKTKEAVEVMSTKSAPAFDALDKAIGSFSDLMNKMKVEVDKNQDADVAKGKTLIVGLSVAGTVLGLIVAVIIARSITSVIGRIVAMIEELAANNLAVDDIDIVSQDEIGKAGAALNTMKNNLRAIIQSIAESAQHVASASEELSSTSQQISANSEETSAQANVVAQAATQVNTNLQSVSTGGEEMTATIQSIASNAHEAATVASNAVQTAQAANATVSKLGVSSAEIGEVIKVITSIAQQTNLLALNATIEAARAGEAGKGFAVVANEVKELAKQTAKATEDISRKIMAIQTDTKGAVEAIGTITGVIGQINDISGTIATAVEEQSATTNEMTRNVADAAKGSGEITRNIEGVAEAARGTSTSAQESQKAADELAEMAVQLRGLVGQFKISTASAGIVTTTRQPAKSRSAQAGA
jgi:methyl-accepting chemotaxis protein